MPNIKSAKKRVLVSRKQNARNKSIKSGLKTSIKKADAAIAENQNAQEAANLAFKTIDKACAKGVLHKNTAARRKAAIARKLNANN